VTLDRGPPPRRREGGGAEFGRNLAGTVRGNPVPVALLGIGLAWLMLADWRGPDGRRRGYGRTREGR
jgi:hypothetical protein